MFDHFRRILLVLAIFLVSGWFYKQWRNDHGGYGLFDLLEGRDEKSEAVTPGSGPLLGESDVPGLANFSAESAKVARMVLPAVVSIDTKSQVKVRPRNMKELLQGFGLGVQSGLGSGVIVSKEGHILTNNHVIAGSNQILVTTNDQKTYPAEVIGANAQVDIAVIKIVDTHEEFSALSFANSDLVDVGEVVFAVGNPFGLSGTFTQGVISATQRRFSDMANSFLQTDTVINPGNSGGPLVNIYGEIVGINVSIFTGDRDVQAWQGVGLAVPANDAKAAFKSLLRQGPPQIGYLGITLRETPVAVGSGFSTTLGVVIDQVQENSPAAGAGLQPGDIIAAINNQPLESPDQVFLLIRSTQPGSKIAFSIIRGGQTLGINATIQARPQM
jgi:serine protease Do